MHGANQDNVVVAGTPTRGGVHHRGCTGCGLLPCFLFHDVLSNFFKGVPRTINAVFNFCDKVGILVFFIFQKCFSSIFPVGRDSALFGSALFGRVGCRTVATVGLRTKTDFGE